MDAGEITYADLYATQAYDHPLVRMRLRGGEIRAIVAAGSGPALFTAGLDDGSKLDPGSTYTVVANALLVATGPFDALRVAPRAGASWDHRSRHWPGTWAPCRSRSGRDR